MFAKGDLDGAIAGLARQLATLARLRTVADTPGIFGSLHQIDF
jgi:hypothetical protein